MGSCGKKAKDVTSTPGVEVEIMQLILASASEGRKNLLSLFKIPFVVIPSTLDEEKIVGKNPLETLKLRARLKGEEVFKKIQISNFKFQIKSKIPINKLTTNNQQPITILSADSGAILDNQLIGKPKDYQDAVKILKALSGKKHEFVTTVYIGIFEAKSRVSILENDFSRNDKYAKNSRINWSISLQSNKKVRSEKFDTETLPKRKILQTYDRSFVTFRNITDEDIKLYLKLTDYTRYAGGYALFVDPKCKKPTLSHLLSPMPFSSLQKKLNCPHGLVDKIEGSISNVIGLPLEKVIPVLRENRMI